MIKIKPWILAARPKTLFATLSPILVAITITNKVYNEVNWTIVSLTVLAALLLQIGSNYANDAYDYIKGADKKGLRKGPKRMAQEGILKPGSILNMMYFIFILSVLIGFYLALVGGWAIVIIGLLSIIFAILYTGGPYPLGYNGLGDITVFIFFGLIATSGTFYLQNPRIDFFMQNIVPILLAGSAIGFLNTSILVVNNIRDYSSDRDSKKRTLVVILGQKFGCYEYAVLLALSYICFVVLGFLFNDYGMVIMISIALPFYILQISRIFKYQSIDLNKMLENTAKLSFLTSIFLYISTFI